MKNVLNGILRRLGLKAEESFFEGSGIEQGSTSILPGNFFKRRLECFLKDPDTYTAIISLTALIVGPGFHVSGDERAVNIVDDFNREVGMDQLLFKAISEMLWAGNSFWLKVYEDGRLTALRHIPSTSIAAIHRSDFEIKALEVQSIGGELLKIGFENVVHFYFIRAWGRGFGIADQQASDRDEAIL